jgi:hypothetical protein
MWLQHTNRLLDDGVLSPGVGPLLEYMVCLQAVSKAGNEALLCFVMIGCEEEGKPVKISHRLNKDMAKICTRRVLTCFVFRNLIIVKGIHLFGS